MQMNIRKIDERIQKLQEIRRIASDPELVSMLLEFIAPDDQRMERADSAPVAKAEAAGASHSSDVDIVNQVVKGMDSQASGLWPRKRA